MQPNNTPRKAGPQPENQIAGTAREQMARAIKPLPKKASKSAQVPEVVAVRLSEVERLLAIVMLRTGRGTGR